MSLLGVDIGTTHLKAVAYDEKGELLAVARRQTPVSSGSGGDAEHDADSVSARTLEAIREVLREIGPPKAIGIASMGESGYLISREGAPLCRAIAWSDPRTIAQADRWRERLPESELFARTGLRAAPLYTACKLEWLRENDPWAWGRAESWLGMAEYLAFYLTSARATDPSLASRTMLYDIDRCEWDTELCRLAGVHPGLLPPVIPSGSPVGSLRGEIAQAIGVPAGIPVSVCGHDHVCAAFGAGALTEGEMLDSMGTAEALISTLSNTRPPGFLSEPCVGFGRHVLPQSYYAVASLPRSGELVNWLTELLGAQEGELEEWTRKAETLRPGAGGIFHPTAGPVWEDGELRAVLFDAHASYGPEHMLLALLEGLSMEMKATLEANPLPIGAGSITVAGGGARSRLWRRIKADIMNRTICSTDEVELTARGAALLAGFGIGVFEDLDAVPRPARVTLERPSERSELYQRIYARRFLPLRDRAQSSETRGGSRTTKRPCRGSDDSDGRLRKG